MAFRTDIQLTMEEQDKILISFTQSEYLKYKDSKSINEITENDIKNDLNKYIKIYKFANENIRNICESLLMEE